MTPFERVVDAVNAVSGFPPTTALLLGILIGAAGALGTVLYLRRRGIMLREAPKEKE
jgi:hypothetical protein